MPVFHKIILTVVLSCAFTTAQADPVALNVKTGLWETKMEGTNHGAAFMPPISEEDLARMPAQQRTRIEAMIKASSANMTPSGNKLCVTEEKLKQFDPDSRRSNCTHVLMKSTPTEQQFKLECSGAATANGVIKVNVVDRENISTDMVIHTTLRGHTTTMAAQGTAKWLSSDCGDVAP